MNKRGVELALAELMPEATKLTHELNELRAEIEQLEQKRSEIKANRDALASVIDQICGEDHNVWGCPHCGHRVHNVESKPERCPVCESRGASPDKAPTAVWVRSDDSTTWTCVREGHRYSTNVNGVPPKECPTCAVPF